jgi:uncharacterized protein YaeQ
MALGATIYNFTVQLSDADRGVYEPLALKVARHPSEGEEYFVARVLAYCLEYREGIAFSPGGLSAPDEPPIAVRDLTGALQAWIDIGTPDAARLHKAGKAARRVAVYTHKNPEVLLRLLAGERIHRAEALELYAIDRAVITGLAERLERRMSLELSVTGGHLYLHAAGTGSTLEGALERIRLAR